MAATADGSVERFGDVGLAGVVGPAFGADCDCGCAIVRAFESVSLRLRGTLKFNNESFIY
jgi:hypothetical protein